LRGVGVAVVVVELGIAVAPRNWILTMARLLSVIGSGYIPIAVGPGHSLLHPPSTEEHYDLLNGGTNKQNWGFRERKFSRTGEVGEGSHRAWWAVVDVRRGRRETIV
jgi:hypothetical protein